ncbi:MAG: N-formylglutamate amidohydrolase [Planctomycetales bacterium]|nr:N-formylglutamate amidohydrolase [Planctomycetales bacterium]
MSRKPARSKPAQHGSEPPVARLLITCEHGGNEVPSLVAANFATNEAQRWLRSHRGYDPGSLDAAQAIAAATGAPLRFSVVSRLVADLNRSLDSPQLFSKFVANESPARKSQLLARFYRPYRRQVIGQVQRWNAAGLPVLHISVHSFTQRLGAARRNFDIGVLFDPDRPREARQAETMLRQLRSHRLRAFANQPYLGTADGLTTTLRGLTKPAEYSGIELEMRNTIARRSPRYQARWHAALAEAIALAREIE